MARKSKSLKLIEERNKKRQLEQDSLLQPGSFNNLDNVEEEYQADEGRRNKKAKQSWDDEEQSYELQPRKLRNDGEEMVEGLPIKINGKVERQLIAKNRKKVTQTNESEDEDSEEENNKNAEKDKDSQSEVEKEDEPDTEEKIIQLQEEIADLVDKLMNEPEEYPAALTRLVKMTTSKNPNTCIFSMLALVPVFKSVIPGYRIRPLTDLEKKKKFQKK